MKSQTPDLISIAPARICLYGDHQDYLGMPVITTAIDRHIRLIAEKNDSNYFEIITPDMGDTRRIELDADFSVFDSSDHYLSSLYILQQKGFRINKGYKITISGNIPINAGVSGSSAIVVAWVQFLLHAYGQEKMYDSEYIAQVAFEAEVEAHGAPGGKMDQYAIAVGNILYLDSGPSFGIKRLNASLPCLILGESGIPKNTIGLLKKTKEGAMQAIKQVKSQVQNFELKDVKDRDIEKYLKLIDFKYQRYFEAAVINHNITLAAFQELMAQNCNPEILGILMNRHHLILKDLLGITVPKIDDMIDAAIAGGAYGAKIVGSGGGGCIVALASEKNKGQVIENILNAGAKAAYEVKVARGAHLHKSSVQDE